jgi:hypothetical protein
VNRIIDIQNKLEQLAIIVETKRVLKIFGEKSDKKD